MDGLGWFLVGCVIFGPPALLLAWRISQLHEPPRVDDSTTGTAAGELDEDSDASDLQAAIIQDQFETAWLASCGIEDEGAVDCLKALRTLYETSTRHTAKCPCRVCREWREGSTV